MTIRDDLMHHRTRWRGMPEIVNFNHTDICNLRCIMCFESVKPGKTRIKVPRIREILGQLLPTARKLKLTSAGEPLLFDFDEISEMAREYDVSLSMITNGTHLTPERYLSMQDILGHLTLSMDSHDRDVFTKIRGKGAFDKIIANLKDLGPIFQHHLHAVHIHKVLMRSNLELFPEFIQFAHDLNVDVVKVLRLHFPFDGLMDREDIFGDFPQETRDKYCLAAIEEAKRLGVNLIMEDLGYPNVSGREAMPLLPERPDTYICGWVAQEVYVDPSENVLPCCMNDESLIMGNLAKESFEEIWNGRKYRRLRREMFEQKMGGYCANCKLYSVLPDDSAYDLRSHYNPTGGGLLKAKLRKAVGKAMGKVRPGAAVGS